MNKQYISANAFQTDCFELATQVYTSGWIPDIVLGVWRGGSLPAIVIHEYLKYKGYDVVSNVMMTQSYVGVGKQSNEVKLDVSDDVVNNLRKAERVLVVDDVVDSGTTMEAICAHFAQCNIEADVKIASVFYKPETASMNPHYYVHQTDQWIIFPHELEGLTKEEVDKQRASQSITEHHAAGKWTEPNKSFANV